MDPSIMKLLEDDEDETLHSTADVEAFTAALNRDIGGGGDADGPNCSAAEGLSQRSSCASKPLSVQSQTSDQDENLPKQIKKEVEINFPSEKQKLSCKVGHMKKALGDEAQAQQLSSHSENDHPQLQEEKPSTSLRCQKNGVQHPQNLQHVMAEVNSQQATDSSRANNSMKQKQSGLAIPIPMLLPLIRCSIAEDKAMQFDSAYSKLQNNEISNNDFIRIMVNIVGNQVLTSAVHQLQMQTNPAHLSLQTDVSSQKHPSSTHQHLTAPKPFLQLPMTLSEDQKNQKLHPEQDCGSTTTNQNQMDASFTTIGNSAEKSHQAMVKSDLNGVHSIQRPSSSIDALNRENQNSAVSSQSTNKKQKPTQLRQSFPMLDGTSGGSNVRACSSISATAPKPLTSQTKEPMLRKASIHPDRISAQIGITPTTKVANAPKQDSENAANETKRLHGGSDSELAGPLTLLKNACTGQALANGIRKEQRSICPSPVGMKQIGQNAETQNNPQFAALASSSSLSTTSHIQDHVTAQPGQMHSQMSFGTPPTSTTAAVLTPKKPVSQRQSREAIDASSAQPSKKQKTTGAPVDQNLELLNDITAVSGVNLREEEEQLLSPPKDEGRTSEATRKVVQEEEERLILQKEPLKKKLAKIISRCGIATVGKDVKRCLSMCAEERLRGLLTSLIRLSKQRVDIEKSRHQFIVTSDVRRQILMMNQKAKEDWEKQQAEEAAKFLKLDEAEGNTGTNASKNKDEGRSKASKANKDVDDKMRTTAANVAARAAVGGDDMLSKWQLMAEQARQKRERSSEATGLKPGANFCRTAQGHQLSGQRGTLSVPPSGGTRKYGKISQAMPHPKIIRSISTKDVIAVLEREPQMSRSNLIFSLYERIHNS